MKELLPSSNLMQITPASGGQITSPSQSIDAIKRLLDEMERQDFGYPIDLNTVRAPSATRVGASLPEQLRPLYEECDGMSLPDVHNGIFIDSAERVLSAPSRGDAVSVGDSLERFVPFGSDGGGNRYAMSEATGAVHILPSSGGICDGRYIAARAAPVRIVAENPSRFIERVEADVRAFVRGVEGHEFI